MDRVAEYAEIVKRILAVYAALKPSVGEVDVETVFDDANGHYELMQTGWSGYQRIHACLIHVDIRDGKIWIQHDGTEDGITPELLESGIPRDRIVLAFQHPTKRKHTPFAVA